MTYSRKKWDEIKNMTLKEQVAYTRALLLERLQDTKNDGDAARIGKVLLESIEEEAPDTGLFHSETEVIDIESLRESINDTEELRSTDR